MTILIFIFIFGLIIGSFLNVVIYRIPQNKSIVKPPSSCPECGNLIKPWHNIPVISYLFLKGKCAYCNAHIPLRYPAIEIISGFLAVLVYKKTGLNIFFFVNFAIFSTLLALSMIDFDYKAVPDSLNLLALTLSFFSNVHVLDNFTNALILMGGMSLIRFYVSYIIKKEAMGEGDIIVAGTMGGMLGVKLSLIAIFIASALAIIPSLYNRIKNSDMELPFVPFLALGTFIVWYFETFFLTLWRTIYG